MTNLPDKQARFVEEYLVDLNATQAAIRAGYREKAAAEIGYEKITKPHIAEAIAEAQEVRSERTEITQDMEPVSQRRPIWVSILACLSSVVRSTSKLRTTGLTSLCQEDEWMDAYGDKEAVGHA